MFILPILLLLFSHLAYPLRNVKTSYGILRGISFYSFPTGQNVHVFKGVPYSKPPIGARRFSLPSPPEMWTGIRDATYPRAACLQNASTVTEPAKFMDEDCLYLHIYTSDKCLESASCTAVLYTFGGDFVKGSPLQIDDEFIIEHYASQDVVFVLPSHRLGIFGSLLLSPSTPPNLATYDIIAALEYINSEISSFGGDSSRVTLMGHSSGSAFAINSAISKRIDPERRLFQRVIGLSGVASFVNATRLSNYCWEFVQRIGCGGNENNSSTVDKVVECLRQKDSKELLALDRQMRDEGSFIGGMAFTAPFVIPDTSIKEFYEDFTPRSLLLGTTQYEMYTNGEHNCEIFGDFSPFKHPDKIKEKYEEDVKNGLVDDQCENQAFFTEVALIASKMASKGEDVFLYEIRQPGQHYIHTSDLYFIIGEHARNFTSDEKIILSFYSQLFVNFTRYRQPSPLWEKFDPKRQNFFNIAVDVENGIWPHTEDGYHKETTRYWLVNMTQFDTSFEQNTTNLPPSSPSKMGSTNKPLLVSSRKPHPTSTRSTLSTEPSATKEEWSIWRQWWLYLLLGLLLIGLCLAVFVIAKSYMNNRPEATPLIH